MRLLFIVTMLLLFSVASFGQSLTSTTTGDKATVKSGEVLTVTTTLKNNSNAVPITITASATYTDALGVEQTAPTGTVTCSVVHPMTTAKLTVPIPTSMTYVANSAKVDTVATTVTATSSLLTIPFSKILNDQDTAVILYQFQAK